MKKITSFILVFFLFAGTLQLQAGTTDLLSFEAYLNTNVVDLKWTIAGEANNSRFTIEKSKDGENFIEVTKVSGGNTSVEVVYFDKDCKPYKGVSYYRLKQIDNAGNISYSNIVPVEFTNNVKGEPTIFPIDAATINMPIKANEGQEVLVVLSDKEGNIVYSKVVITEGIKSGEIIVAEGGQNVRPGAVVTATPKN